MAASNTGGWTATDEDVIRLLENGFRNIDLPPLDPRDIEDIRGALTSIGRAALSKALGQ